MEGSKINLPNVTLIGVDCKDLKRLQLAADICQKGISFGAVKLLSSIESNDKRVVKIAPFKSTTGYSEFCIKEMWKYIDTEYALVFQHDGFILNPSAWTDEFLKYDYIGAPWYHEEEAKVGNGGFSLRSKKLLNLMAQNYEKIGGVLHPEDFWISKTARPFLEKNGIVFAPIQVASVFSKEGSIRGIYWDEEFGFHGLSYTDISKWLNKNPQYKNTFKQKFDDLSSFMKRHPVYDGTFHVMKSKPVQVPLYKKLAKGKQNYDCRMDVDLKYLDEIKSGHNVIYWLYRVSLEKVGIGTFERKVKKVEKFASKEELLKNHPHIKISPSFHIPKWKQRLAKVFGNIVFPNDTSYTLIWFEKIPETN